MFTSIVADEHSYQSRTGLNTETEVLDAVTRVRSCLRLRKLPQTLHHSHVTALLFTHSSCYRFNEGIRALQCMSGVRSQTPMMRNFLTRLSTIQGRPNTVRWYASRVRSFALGKTRKDFTVPSINPHSHNGRAQVLSRSVYKMQHNMEPETGSIDRSHAIATMFMSLKAKIDYCLAVGSFQTTVPKTKCHSFNKTINNAKVNAEATLI